MVHEKFIVIVGIKPHYIEANKHEKLKTIRHYLIYTYIYISRSIKKESNTKKNHKEEKPHTGRSQSLFDFANEISLLH